MSKYANPARCCDLIMKGGITSGILYPPAVCRIAEKFNLVGIGGTSAGAIAACAAAAAEYRRRVDPEDGSGFEMLEQIPHDMSGPGKLEGLFRPDAATRGTHALMLDFLGYDDRSWLGKKLLQARGLWALYRRNSHLSRLVANGFGLCTGMANGNPAGADDDIAPLTSWLHAMIEKIAGTEDRKQPLTFGDLRNAPIPADLAEMMTDYESRSIDLRAVTTCVTFGRPFSLPLSDRIWAFDPVEWRRFFPEDVVDYLVAAAREIETSTRQREGKLPLPIGDAMPVIVAARMSLSFPGLFTMIPLHAVDYNHDDKPLREVWFSDGGITSNLPIQYFDGLFPRWPTLAINLQYTDDSGRPSRKIKDNALTYMIERPGDGTRDLWNVFDGRKTNLKDCLGFGMAIFRSAQGWHDNGMLLLPGYRDRVVEIWLRPDEGGMNLDMPTPVIDELIRRGDEAGIKLRDRFSETTPDENLSWNGHRWTRMRSGLAGLATYLRSFKLAVDHQHPEDPPLRDMFSGKSPAPLHKFEATQGKAAEAAFRQLIEVTGSYAIDEERCAKDDTEKLWPFCGGPRPPVEIGTRAPM